MHGGEPSGRRRRECYVDIDIMVGDINRMFLLITKLVIVVFLIKSLKFFFSYVGFKA